MIKAASNPLAIRSQEWLSKALLLLMEEKTFQEISITEIAEKADLSRRTFYRVFETKEDPLIWHMNLLFQEFLSALQERSCKQFEDVLVLYFNFWFRHKQFFELLKRSELLPMMLNQYLRVFPDVFKMIKGDYPLSQHSDALSYAMAFSAGGLLSVLLKWADEGMTKTPEEILQMMEVMLMPPQQEKM